MQKRFTSFLIIAAISFLFGAVGMLFSGYFGNYLTSLMSGAENSVNKSIVFISFIVMLLILFAVIGFLTVSYVMKMVGSEMKWPHYAIYILSYILSIAITLNWSLNNLMR